MEVVVAAAVVPLDEDDPLTPRTNATSVETVGTMLTIAPRIDAGEDVEVVVAAEGPTQDLDPGPMIAIAVTAEADLGPGLPDLGLT